MTTTANKIKIRVIRGAFVDPAVLDSIGAVSVKKIDDPNWISIDELVVGIDDIQSLQKQMVRHAPLDKAVWYLDGYEIDNSNNVVVAFGADDGENGKLFIFDRGDMDKRHEVINYGLSKGIPAEQLNFAEVSF